MAGKSISPYSPAREQEIREFWKKQGIAEKVRAVSSREKRKFYMMDGPPYASGHIHTGTALNKILKDISMRQKRMQGFNVRDQPGYDTHGLPIEHAVEKKIGVKTKADIEKFGIGNFAKECEKFATEFIGVMNSEFDNLGVWMDWENPYLTLTNEYIEAIWWTFKKAEEKGLLYLGNYPVHACPRCGTAVAYNEIEYVKQTDTSIYVKFPLEQGAKDGRKRFLVIWTTTPWTLPGNAAVMAHPKFEYVEAEVGGEVWVIAKERFEELMKAIEAGYKVLRTFKGKELEGLRYASPLAKHIKFDRAKLKDAYRVIMSDRYVNLEEGTGLVHCAPGHGKEDYDAGSKAGIPALCPVAISGEMTSEAGKYSGKKARAVDAEIIEDLRNDGFLVYSHPHTHDYPVCWRCKTPLIMISTPQWFFKITQIRERLIELNKKVKWVPAYGSDRFNNWLENLGDWPVSRQRYWGTPLPIWVCGKCNERIVMGSIKELAAHAKNMPKELNLHKPWIDEVELECGKCKGRMKRIPEVLDVWFDSGASSWGSLGYPAKTELFRKFWPADLNIEGKDQIRGWWNSQIITSAICFDKAPFETIVMHGIVTDVSKRKMSKSTGNIITPQEVIEKHGRDFLRFYLASQSRGEDMAFGWEAFKDISRLFNTLWNVHNFVWMYLEPKPAEKITVKGLKIEDLWILSRFNSFLEKALENYNKYECWRMLLDLEAFVLEDLSRTYIKLVRGRAGGAESKVVENVLNYILFALTKVLAPVTPHISEHLYQNIRAKGMAESVHMLLLPEPEKKMIDKKLEENMGFCFRLGQAALALRDGKKLRLRWQLGEVVVKTKTGKMLGRAKEVLAAMCNVKAVRETTEAPRGNYAESVIQDVVVYLSLDADEKLREEWELAELVRRIQAQRKELGLMPGQRAELELECSDCEFAKKYAKEIEESSNTRIVQGKGKMEKLVEREFYIRVKK